MPSHFDKHATPSHFSRDWISLAWFSDGPSLQSSQSVLSAFSSPTLILFALDSSTLSLLNSSSLLISSICYAAKERDGIDSFFICGRQ